MSCCTSSVPVNQQGWTSKQKADHFIENETQYHLGFLPTEQSNPLTKNLTKDFQESAEKGVESLLKVDFQIIPVVNRVLNSEKYQKLVKDGMETIKSVIRIIFSGCGSTGRLSILLQAIWKRGCREANKPELRY